MIHCSFGDVRQSMEFLEILPYYALHNNDVPNDTYDVLSVPKSASFEIF